MTRKRVVLLLILGLLVLGIVQQQAVAADLDAACGSICERSCIDEGGCRLFRTLGCNCHFICGSGLLGRVSCGW